MSQQELTVVSANDCSISLRNRSNCRSVEQARQFPSLREYLGSLVDKQESNARAMLQDDFFLDPLYPGGSRHVAHDVMEAVAEVRPVLSEFFAQAHVGIDELVVRISDAKEQYILECDDYDNFGGTVLDKILYKVLTTAFVWGTSSRFTFEEVNDKSSLILRFKRYLAS